MSSVLIPQVFWFRLSIPCRRIDGLPRRSGRLLDLPEECAFPSAPLLEGQTSWAEVRSAWNPKGLALSFEVVDKPGRIVHDPIRPEASDSVEFWIDSRDTRDVHRATRFCHRFSAAIVPEGRTGPLSVVFRREPINRALASPPPGAIDKVEARAERVRKKDWRIELFLPAEAVHGFDPDTNCRLGFSYRLTDSDRGDQFLGVGREFPVAEDPSLWSTLELVDSSGAPIPSSG